MSRSALATGDADEYTALAVVEGRGGYVVAAAPRTAPSRWRCSPRARNLMTGDVQVQRQDYELPSLAGPSASCWSTNRCATCSRSTIAGTCSILRHRRPQQPA
jgi:hypothetical protein